MVECGGKGNGDCDGVAEGECEGLEEMDLVMDHQFLFEDISAEVDGINGSVSAVQRGCKEDHFYEGVNVSDTLLLCL